MQQIICDICEQVAPERSGLDGQHIRGVAKDDGHILYITYTASYDTGLKIDICESCLRHIMDHQV